MSDDFFLDPNWVNFELARTESSTVKRGLRNQSVTWRKTQNGTRNKGKTQDEEIPMISWRLLEIELWALRENGTDIMINNEQKEEHETGNHGCEDATGINSFHRIYYPGSIGGGLPVPWSDDIHAINSTRAIVGLFYARKVAESSSNHNGNQCVVTLQKDSNLSGEQSPRFGKVQGPGNVEGQESNKQGSPFGSSARLVISVSPVDGLDQVTERCVDEGNGTACRCVVVSARRLS
jgi:hypothetical protein